MYHKSILTAVPCAGMHEERWTPVGFMTVTLVTIMKTPINISGKVRLKAQRTFENVVCHARLLQIIT